MTGWYGFSNCWMLTYLGGISTRARSTGAERLPFPKSPHFTNGRAVRFGSGVGSSASRYHGCLWQPRRYEHRGKRHTNGLKACTTQTTDLHASVVQGFSPSMYRLCTVPRIHSDGGRNLPLARVPPAYEHRSKRKHQRPEGLYYPDRPTCLRRTGLQPGAVPMCTVPRIRSDGGRNLPSPAFHPPPPPERASW